MQECSKQFPKDVTTFEWPRMLLHANARVHCKCIEAIAQDLLGC
jgi:hypothetical protein